VLCNDGDGSVDLNLKILTLQPSIKSHRTQWKKENTDELSVEREEKPQKRRWIQKEGGGELPWPKTSENSREKTELLDLSKLFRLPVFSRK
jgi:hypothetical protein